MELTRSKQFLIFVCLLSMLIISIFFFVETINQQAYTNRIIKACNESRNQIAQDYDFNLIEYDENHKRFNQTDFNFLDVVK